MKFLMLLSFIAPKDTLPPTADLFASLQAYHLAQTNAQLAEYQESTEGEWLKYIPAISFGYGLGTKEVEGQTQVVGKFRPSVSFSTSVIYNAKKGQQLRAAKIKSIEASNLLRLQQEERKLLQLIANYEQELRSLAVAQEIQEIEDAIFEIQETKFEHRELAPLQYLPLKRNYLQKRYAWGRNGKSWICWLERFCF